VIAALKHSQADEKSATSQFHFAKLQNEKRSELECFVLLSQRRSLRDTEKKTPGPLPLEQPGYLTLCVFSLCRLLIRVPERRGKQSFP